MKLLTTLNEDFKAIIIEVGTIKQCIFDDLSSINADSQADYPLLLVKPPLEDGLDEDRTFEFTQCNMDLFLFDTHFSDKETEWISTYDDCRELLIESLKKLFAMHPKYVLVGNLKITPGHMEHNANLIAARAQFKLRVYNGC